MVRPIDTTDVGIDPEAQRRYRELMAQPSVEEIAPPAEDHPLVAYAKSVVAPMYGGPSTDSGPTTPPYGGPSTVFAPRSLAGIDTSGLSYGSPVDFSGVQNLLSGIGQQVGPVLGAIGEQYIDPLKVWEQPKQRARGDVGPVHNYLRDLLAPIPGQIGSGLDEFGDVIREAAGKPPVRSLQESGYQRPETPADESSGDRAKRLLARGAGGALSVSSPFALPYTAVSGELVAHQVESDQTLGPEYKRRLASFSAEKQQSPAIRSQVAHEVIDSAVRRLLDVRNDPNATEAQKNSADALAGLLIGERFAEFGGPQGLRQLGQLGLRGIKALAPSQGSIPRAELAARIGATESETIAPRIGAETSAQRANAEYLARQVSERSAGAETQPIGTTIGSAIDAESRRVLRLSSQAATPEGIRPAGITAAQAEAAYAFLERGGAPSDLLAKVRTVVDAAKTAQEEANVATKFATQSERGAAKADLRAADQLARGAVRQEAKTQSALTRAENDLAVGQARLSGIEQRATEQAVRTGEREAAIRAAQTEAVARVPGHIDDLLARMEERLTDTGFTASAGPANIARALRAEAKRIRRDEIAQLPKRGLVGSREQQEMGPVGFERMLGQTGSQTGYGSGLTLGRNTYRKTADRLSLEERAQQMDDLAGGITSAHRALGDARKSVTEARRPLTQLSAEERQLGPSYAKFLGIDEQAVAQSARDAHTRVSEASSSLRDLLGTAKELGVRPREVDEAQRLVEGLRSDVAGLRGAVDKARLFASENAPVEVKAAATVEQEIARGQNVIDTATVETTPVRLAGSGAGDVPIETGYAAPKDEAILDEFGVNISKWDSPSTRKVMADVLRRDPERFRSQTLTLDEIVNRVALKAGVTPEALQAALPRRGELSSTLFVADAALDKTAGDVVAAAKRLKSGATTQEDFDAIYGVHVDMQLRASEGTSEVARALGVKRVIRPAGALDVIQAQGRVRDTQKGLDSAAREFDRISADARKVEATAAEMPQPQASAALEEARLRVQQAREKIEAAKAEHDAAIESAAETSDKAHAAYLQAAVKTGMTKDQITVLAQLDPHDVMAIHTFIRNQRPLQKGEILGGYLLNNTYGSIPSLENNFLNTGLHVLYQNAVVRPLSEVSGKAIAKVVGETIVAPGETGAAWLGLWSAIPDATRLFMRTVMQGEAPELSLKYGLLGLDKESALKFGYSARPIAPGPKGLAVEGVLRILGGSDGFWRVLDSAAESRALVVRNAYAKGLRGDAINNELARFIAAPDQQILDRVSQVSLRDTFNDPAKVGSATHKFLALLNADFGTGFAPLRILIPAARFGIAAAHHSLNLTGFGLVSGANLTRAARAARGVEKINLGRQAAREFTEGALGAMMIVAADQLYNAGLLTGAAPANDPVALDEWKRQGKQQDAVLIGGKWVSFSTFGPLSSPFLMVALLRDQMAASTNAELSDRIERASMAIGHYLTDLPAFSGTYRLLDTIYSGLKYGASVGTEKFAALQLDKFIPEGGTLNSLVPFWDSYERDPENLIQRLQGRIPVMSTSLPAAVDRFGRPIERAVSGPGALSPLQASTPRALDAVEQELQNEGHRVGFVADSIGGEKLTAAEAREYQAVAGQRTHTALDRVIASPEYRSESDPVLRQRMRDRAIDAERAGARAVVADNAINAATTEPEVIRAAKMVRSTLDGLREVAYFYEQLQQSGKLTAAVADELDRTRALIPGGERAPSVSEMLRVVPAVHEFLGIPPFRIGTPQEWAELRDAQRRMADYVGKNPPPNGVTELTWYSRSDPQSGALIRRYQIVGANPARKRYLDAHPEIVPYLEMTVPIQVIPNSLRP